MADQNTLLDSYYEEIDPVRRRALLDEYIAAVGDSDPVLEYRKALYDCRHINPANPDKIIDRFMLAFLDYLYLYRNSIVLPGRNVPEVRKILRGLEVDERVHSDPLFAQAFSMEVRNAARRYFDTCKSDGYHRKFFGISASKADEKEKQRCIDTWRMSYGIAQRVGLEGEMALFCQALSEEYRLSRVDGLSLEEAYRALK